MVVNSMLCNVNDGLVELIFEICYSQGADWAECMVSKNTKYHHAVTVFKSIEELLSSVMLAIIILQY